MAIGGSRTAVRVSTGGVGPGAIVGVIGVFTPRCLPMDQSFLSELFAALDAVRATSMSFAIIGFFAIAAIVLWMWRGAVKSSDDDE